MKAKKVTGTRAKAGRVSKKQLCARYAEVLRLRQKIIETQSAQPAGGVRPMLH